MCFKHDFRVIIPWHSPRVWTKLYTNYFYFPTGRSSKNLDDRKPETSILLGSALCQRKENNTTKRLSIYVTVKEKNVFIPDCISRSTRIQHIETRDIMFHSQYYDCFIDNPPPLPCTCKNTIRSSVTSPSPATILYTMQTEDNLFIYNYGTYIIPCPWISSWYLKHLPWKRFTVTLNGCFYVYTIKLQWHQKSIFLFW